MVSIRGRLDKLERHSVGQGVHAPPDVQELRASLRVGTIQVQDLTDEQLERMLGEGWDDGHRAAMKSLSTQTLLAARSGNRQAMSKVNQAVARYRRLAESGQLATETATQELVDDELSAIVDGIMQSLR